MLSFLYSLSPPAFAKASAQLAEVPPGRNRLGRWLGLAPPTPLRALAQASEGHHVPQGLRVAFGLTPTPARHHAVPARRKEVAPRETPRARAFRKPFPSSRAVIKVRGAPTATVCPPLSISMRGLKSDARLIL